MKTTRPFLSWSSGRRKPQHSCCAGAKPVNGGLSKSSVPQPMSCPYSWHTRQLETHSESPDKCLRVDAQQKEEERRVLSAASHLSTGAKRGHPFCPPSLCKGRTLNKATSTLAVRQRAQSQPCCFCCKHELPVRLQVSPRGSHFLPQGRGGWLSHHPTAVRLTRRALQPEDTLQPSPLPLVLS